MKDASVFIGVPSQESWKADFGMCMVQLTAMLSQPFHSGAAKIRSCRIWNTKGSILPRSRTTLVRQALQGDYSHILFIDSDMTFPADLLQRLLDRDKAVIACNCPVKALPSSPTARLKGGERGEPLFSVPDDLGIRQVWRVGTGIMLVRTSIFRQLSEPWFPIMWNEKLQDYIGEDWAFCEKLEQADIPIYVDLQMSKQIGHIGSFIYEHKHVEKKDGL